MSTLDDAVLKKAAAFMGQRFRTEEEIQNHLKDGKKRAPSLEQLTQALTANGYPVLAEKHGGATYYTTPSRPRPRAAPATVYFLSEVGYDTFMFEQEESQRAYRNALMYMAQDPDIAGIVIDGVHTRLDRPEFLNTELTYWHMDEEAASLATQEVKNYEQLEHMFEIQMRILDERLAELRKILPQQTKIMLNIATDDLGYTISANLNELLIRKQAERSDKIEKLKIRAGKIKAEWKQHLEDANRYSGKRQEKEAARAERAEKNRTAVEGQIDEMMREQRLFREKKIRPMHQHVTRELVEYITLRYGQLCEKHNVELITKEGVLEIGGIRMDYAHSRHDTPNVVKERDKALIRSLHGGLPEIAKKGIDAIVESGHHGIGFSQRQKTKNGVEEMNFRNQGRYDVRSIEDIVTILMVMPFENQKVIADIMKGEYSDRFALSKPRATRKHATIDRYKNGGVTGLTFLRRSENGVLGTGWIAYNRFSDGSAAKKPSRFVGVYTTSDEHLCSPEEDRLVLLGAQADFGELAKKPSTLRGVPFVVGGYLSGGDTAEANSRKWNDRYQHRTSAEVILKRNLSLLRLGTSGIDDLVAAQLRLMSQSMQGSTENMPTILRQVADYYGGFLAPALEHSTLRHALVATTGNHADGVLKDLGFREADFFRERNYSLAFQVGEDLPEEEFKDKRIWLGGYSVSRGIFIPDYGVDINGKPLFGPVGVMLQHDPKGSHHSGLVGAGRSADADLALAGHTHETWVRVSKKDEGEVRFAYRMATMQGVSATELYYAESHPRTQASNLWVMPSPGILYEETRPAVYLRAKGREQIELAVKRALLEKV